MSDESKEPRFKVVSNREAIALGATNETLVDPDFGWAIVERLADGSYMYVGSDGGQPEDQLLVRDWEWVCVELNRLADESAVAERAYERQRAATKKAQDELHKLRLKVITGVGIAVGLGMQSPGVQNDLEEALRLLRQVQEAGSGSSEIEGFLERMEDSSK